ncbi:uncharacterized protein LOC141671684 isoform X1 [Apium graveolens]|uniref:uncharacterized protein LOC141671684 isoform X1 n=1 Tax=Apium graveolens TaxID=4045 RepID=UPI003D7A64A4
MESVLKKHFGYSTFRPYQKQIIEHILDGNDSLVVMATGSGKSLCYQVPPLISNKTAVVISPLISLMQDQVMTLKQRGIRAEYLSSAHIDSTVQTNAQSGKFHILYMTPEKACLLSNSFWSKLLNIGICLLAVDEAHCISEWGHNFRVEYKQLDKLRDLLINVPFVGLTATATEKVQSDIINSLKLKDPYVAVGSFDRKNLFYGAKASNRGSSSVFELVEEILRCVANSGSIIIYCTSIKDVEQISKSLLETGVESAIYHGQMASKAREESHRSFIRDEIRIMVATIAFGMGIDKPDIRHVIHYGCPKSLESYYQESGRCGRDGIASNCWLYYRRSDFAKADFYCREARSESQRKAIMASFIAAQQYCMLRTCRRKYLLEYFGEICAYENCGYCDNCTIPKKEIDMSKQSFLLMACIKSCGGRWGLNIPVDVLRGSRSKKIVDAQYDKLPFHGLGKEISANWWKTLASQLISFGFLTENLKDVYKTISHDHLATSVSPNGMHFLTSCTPDHQPPLLLPVGEEEHKNAMGDGGDFNMDYLKSEGLLQGEVELYKMLLEERMNLARSAGIAPYAICGDQTIKKFVLLRPSTKARLANIDGVNQHLLVKYGDRILQAIRDLSKGLGLSLDGVPNLQAVNNQNICTASNHLKELTPAKFQAWKMWYEDGLSFEKIANFPGRTAPIKVQTVVGYILDAARQGCALDWMRFSEEIGLTQEAFMNIQVAIMKVGSKDKLKPIKDELPEEVSYTHITAVLTMADLGLTRDALASSHWSVNEANEMVDISKQLDILSHVESKTCKLKEPVNCVEGHLSSEENKAVSRMQEFDDQHSLRKRQKVDPQENLVLVEATEDSIIKWLGNFENGVSLPDFVDHFNGSTEESIAYLLSCLESEFLIYKKNDNYKLM